jgi:hypothetical protein
MTTFTEHYIIDDHDGPVRSSRSGAAHYASRGRTVWHIQADVAPRDVTEDLASEGLEADAAFYRKHKLFANSDDSDEGPHRVPSRSRSDYAEHALGWENV